MVYESSLGDGLETTHCLFPHLQQTAKNSNSLFRDFKADKVYLGISEQIKPLQLVCQAAVSNCPSISLTQQLWVLQ